MKKAKTPPATPMHRSVVASLQSARGGWRRIAEASGVPLRTIEKIARSEIENPGVGHIERLHAYFVAARLSEQSDQAA